MIVYIISKESTIDPSPFYYVIDRVQPHLQNTNSVVLLSSNFSIQFSLINILQSLFPFLLQLEILFSMNAWFSEILLDYIY